MRLMIGNYKIIKMKKNRMDNEFRQKHSEVDNWCRVNFGEAFSAWMHIKAIRVFVESALRYSLPVNFEAFVIQVNRKYEKQLRSALKLLYVNLGGNRFSTTNEADEAPGTEFYPYVSVTFTL